MLSSVNSTNPMSNISAIQRFSAVNAFKNATVARPQVEDPFTTDGTEINDDSILKSQNVSEIRKFAEMAGENNLTEEDIKYGLSYGRSVIVEYLA